MQQGIKVAIIAGDVTKVVNGEYWMKDVESDALIGLWLVNQP